MPLKRHCIAHPWILRLVENYGQSATIRTAVAAKVVKFVKMAQNRLDNLPGPAAVVHISDREFYIQAVITNDARRKMEEEEEHFNFEDIHNKVIVLKEFEIVFRQEEELVDCGFYIRIEYFSILPMEPDREDGGINCNEVPMVKWKIKEHWQKYREESEIPDTPGVGLTQLLNVANEEKLNDLKNTAYSCLDLRGSSPSTHRATASCHTGRSKTDKHVFSVPINWLIISPEEEEILNNLEEWRDDYSVANDSDEREFYQEDVRGDTLSSTPETSPASHTSQEFHLVLSSKDDGLTLPDSSTPDILEHMEENFPNKIDSSPPLLFSDSSMQSQGTCEETDTVSSETVTNIDNAHCTDGGVACCLRSNCEKNSSIPQYPLNCSPPSQVSSRLDINYGNKESEDKICVNEEEMEISETLGPDMVMCPLNASHGDIIQPDEKEQPNEKKPGQYLKQQAAKRAHPVELITEPEKEQLAGLHSCSWKRPKMKGSPLRDQESIKAVAVPCEQKLQFLNDQENRVAEEANATTKSVLIQAVPSKTSESFQENQNSTLNEKEQVDSYLPTLQPPNNMRHFDGSSLQYKYNAAEPDLCTRVRSTRLRRKLVEWAFTIGCKSKEQGL